MRCIKDIEYGTKQYIDTLELRNKVMRKPIDRDIKDDRLDFEKNAKIVGVFDDETLLGCGVMTHKGAEYKLEFLCVDTDLQKSGVGSEILCHLEKWAMALGAKKICIDARVTAQKFYERYGYKGKGDFYFMANSPVDHLFMEKDV